MVKRLLLVNLALFGLLALLALLIGRELAPRAPADRLSELSAEQVGRIVIERDGGDMLRLVRDRQRWRLVEPRALPASEFHVASVLALLEAPVGARYPVAQMDLEALGLSRPRLRLRLGDQAFVFGDIEPLSRQRYLLHGEQVLLIQDSVSPLLRGPWWNFIDRSLLGVTDEIVAIELADGRMLLGPPLHELLNRWRAASARIVQPMQPAEAALGDELVMRLASGEQMRWRLVDGEQPRVLRADLELAYHIDSPTLAALSAPPSDAID